MIAGHAPVIIRREDAVVGGPPVPAQPLERRRHLLAVDAEWQRRCLARRAGWHGRVARQSADAEFGVVLLVVGCQILIADRPVGRALQAMLGPLAEIARAQAGPVGVVVRRAAADRVVQHHIHARRVHRVIGRRLPDGRAAIPVAPQLELPLVAVVRVIARQHPRPLLQADDAHAARTQAPGDRRPGHPGADDQHVGRQRIAHRSASFVGRPPSSTRCTASVGMNAPRWCCGFCSGSPGFQGSIACA